jgi:hypothetical protein
MTTTHAHAVPPDLVTLCADLERLAAMAVECPRVEVDRSDLLAVLAVLRQVWQERDLAMIEIADLQEEVAAMTTWQSDAQRRLLLPLQ